MRSLSTLATLLLGLAVVFWAPVAKAHCPHNDDETHAHCGGGSATSNVFQLGTHLPGGAATNGIISTEAWSECTTELGGRPANTEVIPENRTGS